MTEQQFSIYVTKRESSPRTTRHKAIVLGKDQQTSYLEWVAYGFRHLGDSLVINNHSYEVVDPVDSFGYVVRHIGGAVAQWDDRLIGVEQPVGENMYRLAIPENGAATIKTVIDVHEYGLFNWLTWLLLILFILLAILLWWLRNPHP